MLTLLESGAVFTPAAVITFFVFFIAFLAALGIVRGVGKGRPHS